VVGRGELTEKAWEGIEPLLPSVASGGRRWRDHRQVINAILAAMRARGIAFTSPERSDQIARRKAKGSRGGRPSAFDPERYTGRNVVERCFNRLKQFRSITTRYAKRIACYRSEIIIAAIAIWLRADLQDTP
jgi:transposase